MLSFCDLEFHFTKTRQRVGESKQTQTMKKHTLRQAYLLTVTVKLGVVSHTFNSITWKAEAGRVQGLPGLQIETPPKETK